MALTSAAAAGDLAKASRSGDAALSIAREHGWPQMQVVIHMALGAIFLWRAFVLLRQATSPEGSLAQAIRLYRYSISYLTLLFVAVGIDPLLPL